MKSFLLMQTEKTYSFSSHLSSPHTLDHAYWGKKSKIILCWNLAELQKSDKVTRLKC